MLINSMIHIHVSKAIDKKEYESIIFSFLNLICNNLVGVAIISGNASHGSASYYSVHYCINQMLDQMQKYIKDDKRSVFNLYFFFPNPNFTFP